MAGTAIRSLLMVVVVVPISEVCADIDSEKGVHAAAHDVVHVVGDKLGEG